MVDNPETDSLIGWSEDGNSFLIRNHFEFTKQMLPYYYKHSNMASFVRQLNMYGFHKVMSVDSGGLKGENDESEFSHPYFMRGQEHLLDQIKRKVSTASQRPAGVFLPSIKSEKVNEVLSEVSLIKDRQEDIDGKLDTMKNENEALWREVLSLRQKHTQQQKIVNKLIQFLVALVQPRMGGGSIPQGKKTIHHHQNSGAMKRRYAPVPGHQLAIEEGGGGQSSPKQPRLSEGGPVIQEMEEHDISNMTGSQLQEFLNISEGSVTTPVETEPPVVVASSSSSRPQPTASPVKQESGSSNGGSQQQGSKYRLVDPASVNPALIQKIVKSEGLKRPVLHREISKEDFDLDINSMQKELDNLKDILSGQITLDSTLVSSLFNVDDSMPNMNLFNESLLNQEEEASHISASGQQGQGSSDTVNSLVTYNPSLFELTDEGDLMGPPTSVGRPSKETTPQSGSAFDIELNTPQITEDQTDPLIRLLGKK